MDASTIMNYQEKELLDAQAHIWNHMFAYQYSMSLKCALELGIPDAIHNHGKPLSLIDLTKSLSIHPSKVASFHRLMRLLCHSNFFSLTKLPNGELTYDLTINSKLLVKDHPQSFTPFASFLLDPVMTDPASNLSSWFKNDDETPFNTAHGRSVWDQATLIASFSDGLNDAAASDARFVASLFESNSDLRSLFDGFESLVDVGGGDGTMAKAIAKVNPGLKCIVFDLPHVVNGLKYNQGEMLTYVAGDMFEAIPPADLVLLKWVLHDWSDDHCIKILQQCKAAIMEKGKGGKVIIIDMVVEKQGDSVKYLNTQYLFDMEMMCITIGGKQRNEDEWKKLFIQAGFHNYKIFSVLGTRSIIEVYPH